MKKTSHLDKNSFKLLGLTVGVIALLAVIFFSPQIKDWLHKPSRAYTPQLTYLYINPSILHIALNKSYQFTYTALDQYNQPIAITPLWAVTVSAAGKINQQSGLFTSGTQAGTYINSVKLTAVGTPLSTYAKVVTTDQLFPTLLTPLSPLPFQLGANISFSWSKGLGTQPSNYAITYRPSGLGGNPQYIWLNSTNTSFVLPAATIETTIPDGSWDWTISAKIDDKIYPNPIYRKITNKKTGADLFGPDNGVVVKPDMTTFDWADIQYASNYIIKISGGTISGITPQNGAYYIPVNNGGASSQLNLTTALYNTLQKGKIFTWSVAGTALKGTDPLKPNNLLPSDIRLPKLAFSPVAKTFSTLTSDMNMGPETQITTLPEYSYPTDMDKSMVVLMNKYTVGGKVTVEAYVLDVTTRDLKKIHAYSSAALAEGSTPRISGNVVVWAENGHIWKYDLAQIDLVATQLTDGAIDSDPDIYQDKIVFSRSIDGGATHNIYQMTTAGAMPPSGIANKLTTLPTGADALSPRLDGNIIVWIDNRNGNDDVYSYNLVTAQEKFIVTEASPQSHVQIWSDKKIVWEDNRPGANNDSDNIYVYSLADQTTKKLASVITNQNFPQIYDKFVVYEGFKNDGTGLNIYMYNLQNNYEYNISEASKDQELPFVWAETAPLLRATIVWADYRKDNPPAKDYHSDIYMRQLIQK